MSGDATIGSHGLAARLHVHLETTYGVVVDGVAQLDEEVYRVDCRDGARWVARVLRAGRPAVLAHEDADILGQLAKLRYPAERCALEASVSDLAGRSVLVTEYVPSVARERRREAIRGAGGLAALGALLAHLQTLPMRGASAARRGGAWHHLADGGPADELRALGELLAGAGDRTPGGQIGEYESLAELVCGLDDAGGLPESFVHPDFVMANVVAAGDGRLVLVDWTGAGRAARMWPLAFLLWSVGHGGDLARVERTVAGYRAHLQPEPEELERLTTLVGVRPAVFDTWAFCTDRKPLAEAIASIEVKREAAEAIAARAQAAFKAA